MDRQFFEPTGMTPKDGLRAKSAVRMRYEAEVKYLREQHGDLEQIRARLGLSRRKMCELLLVDASAWTRWTAPGGEAPPHIYRALDWYLSHMEKDPEYRHLAKRFAGWLNHEKDHEGRLLSLETMIGKGRPRFSWQDVAVPLLAFLGGVLMVYFTFRPH